MKNKKSLLTVLLVLILCAAMALSLAACNPKEKEEPTESDDLLISNGDFIYTDSDNYPYSPKDWTGSTGKASGDNATPSDSTALVKGIIDVSPNEYNKHYSKWDKLPNPGKVGADDYNILMIYNKEPTVYSYKASNLKVELGKYYKVSVWVKTVNVDRNGAFISLSSSNSSISEFEYINTNGYWTEYSFYVQGSAIQDTSLTLDLALGRGDMTRFPAEGYAFFDHITMEEVEADVYEDAETGNRAKKMSLFFPDAEFDNIYTTNYKQPFTSNSYTGVRSQGSDGSYAESGSSASDRGILDLNEAIYSGVAWVEDLSPAPGSVGSRMLYIQNKKKTAYGYRAKTPVRFESNSYAAVSVWVRTEIEVGSGAGAVLKLTTGSDDDDLNIVISGIDTGNQWQKFTFLVESNKLRSRDLYLEMWLGQGGNNDIDNTQGVAFFDSISMQTLSETEFNAYAGEGNEEVEKFSLVSDPANELGIPNGDFTSGLSGWEQYKDPDNDVIIGGRNSTNVYDTSAAWSESFDNPLSPSTSLPFYNKVLGIRNLKPTAYSMRLTQGDAAGSEAGHLVVNPNTYYRISFWVKTVDIDESQGFNAYLKRYNKPEADDLDSQNKDTRKDSEIYTTLASFENINSKNFKSVTDENNNNYVELVFLIEGSNLESGELILEFALGTGTRYQADKHVKGDAFVAGVSREIISASEYTSTSTSTTVKKASLPTEGTDTTITNSQFNKLNVQDTLNRFEDEGYLDATDDFGNPLNLEAFDTNGNLYDAFGSPQGWTATNTSLLANLYAGVMDTLNPRHFDLLLVPNNNTFFDGYGDGAPSESSMRNILALSTKAASTDGYLNIPTNPAVCGCTCEDCLELGYCDGNTCENDCDCLHKNFPGYITNAIGYTSSSFTLAKNGYYAVNVWARAEVGTTYAAIVLEAGKTKQVIEIPASGQWAKYTFYVETGLSDISAKLGLYLGNPDPEDSSQEGQYQGTVFFDAASYVELAEENYDTILENINDNQTDVAVLNLTTDSFDEYTEADEDDTYALGTPSDWSRASLNSDAPSAAPDVISGVFDRTKDNTLLLAPDDSSELPSTVYDAIFNDSVHDRILVINNRLASAITYTNSSVTLAVNSYYKISVQVLTWGLEQHQNATISLKLNNLTYTFGNTDRRVNTSTYSGSQETVGEWTTFTFFVNTAPKTSISNVRVILGLGTEEEEEWIKGSVFFDEVSITKISEDTFNQEVPVVLDDNGDIVEENYDKAYKFRIAFTEEDILAEEPKDDDKDGNGLLWLFISTGIIGGLIIVVVIVYFARKYIKPKKRAPKKMAPYDASKNKTNNTNHKKDFKD